MKLIFLFIIFSVKILSQTFTIQGVVKDSISGDLLSSANVYCSELDIGVSTNDFGQFKIQNIKAGNYSLKISFIGYSSKLLNIKINSDKKVEVYLSRILITLEHALIQGTYPKFRETAVAFSKLTAQDINLRLGTKEAVHILDGTPNAYISQQGGGSGEQRLNLRGFDQTNIAVMINGIPINNPENGQVYWSNWAGISDLIEYVHVQRGLSAIPYSISAIGGSVNFVTANSSQLNSKIRFKSEFGSYNLKKNSISFSNNLSDNISLTGLVSKKTSNGYADNVYSDELTYFLSLKVLLEKQIIQFQLFGSPQKHGQRLTQQTINEWANFGKKYNPDWGYLNGKALNLRDNEFHNPTVNISHNWQISKKLFFTNILSLSHGNGGGTVPPWFPELTRTESGQINFDREWEINNNNIDPNYNDKLARSVLALRKGTHKNYWGTVISVFKYDLNNIIVNLGFDGKLYKAQNYNQLSNLLGGDYYIGSNNIILNPNKLLTVGDKVDFNADSFTRSYGTFLQTEYKLNSISTYFSISFSTTHYNRIDYFNFLKSDPNRETGWKNFNSFTLKGGFNYNLNENNNVYFNVGSFSRAPLSMNVFDFSNNLYENTKNEKINSVEVGYGLQNNYLKINLNYYYTSWKDKAYSQSFLNNDSTAIYYYNIFGASAIHTGIEFDAIFSVTKNLKANAMFSYSSNKWTNDIDAYVRPEANPVDEIKYHAFTNNLYVGNNPMTKISLSIFYDWEFSKGTNFYFNPIYNFYGLYYSNFDPALRTNPNDKNKQSWKIPDFYNLDLHIGIAINLHYDLIKSLNISFNIFNILNRENIIDATDGNAHNSKNAKVWYGNERWWSSSVAVNF